MSLREGRANNLPIIGSIPTTDRFIPVPVFWTATICPTFHQNIWEDFKNPRKSKQIPIKQRSMVPSRLHKCLICRSATGLQYAICQSAFIGDFGRFSGSKKLYPLS
jgi:hypothetical protein